MTFEQASQLLGEYIRVHDGMRLGVRVQGEVIAVIPAPVLVIVDRNGVKHYESSTLPLEKAMFL